jgi:hypothetical protein
MKVTLKKIKVSESLSEETTAFTADVYIDGILVGHAKNDGQGGCTFIHSRGLEGRFKLDTADRYFASMPPQKHVLSNGETIELPVSVDSIVDDLIDKYQQEKYTKKVKARLRKDMLQGLAFGTEEAYTLVRWGQLTIADLLKTPTGRVTIYKKVVEMQDKGLKLLNTNLPKLTDMLLM